MTQNGQEKITSHLGGGQLKRFILVNFATKDIMWIIRLHSLIIYNLPYNVNPNKGLSLSPLSFF